MDGGLLSFGPISTARIGEAVFYPIALMGVGEGSGGEYIIVFRRRRRSCNN